MTRIAALAGNFALFWWDFLVGDDWRIATGVVIALAGTAALARTSLPAWWLLPVAVCCLVAWSLRRAIRGRG